MKTLRRFFPRAAATALLLLTVAAATALAQQAKVRLPQASPSATVMQTIGVTDLTIIYHRPAVKNRIVWGDVPAAKLTSLGPNASTEATLDGSPGSGKELPLAPYGHVWRAGANDATKFVVSDDVLVNGQKLAAGAYSLHAIPGSGEWTIIFNKVADQWGSFRYDAKQDALRVKVKPEAAPMQEQLSYEIPSTTPNSARVVLRWEKVAVPFTVEVPNVDALVRSKVDAVVAANPNDWQIPLTVGNAYFNDDKFEDAMKWTEQSIKVKETFQNLATKAQLLFAMGKKDEAVAVADKAIARGKADGADTTRFEKRLADLKAGKM
ncbi:MAG: hypothetical protein QOJ76_847 [Acidobacteriota bacterium]|nr:hypothetical protein [Acidobacteriota bacterium]